MTPRLIYRNGEGRLTAIQLTVSQEEVRIGRDSESCRVHAQDPMLSGVHALVRYEQGTWVVEDCNSANHTYLNDSVQPITKASLVDRDVIRCASLWIQCRIPSAAAPVVSPPPLVSAKEQAELQTRLSLCRQETEGVRQQLRSTSSELDRMQRDSRETETKLAASERTAAALSRELQRHIDDLKTSREQIGRLELAASTSASELSSAQAESKKLQEQLQIGIGREVQAQTAHELLMREVSAAHEKEQDLQKIISEHNQLVESQRHAVSDLQQQLQTLSSEAKLREAAFAQLRAERERMRDEQQVAMLALSRAHDEIRQLKQDIGQLQRLLGSQRESGQELSRLSSELAKAKLERDAGQQQLAALRDQFEVVLDGVRGAILSIAEYALAIQKGWAQREGNMTNREEARRLAETIDQMVLQAEDAQGQLRGLRRLIS